MTRHLIFLSAPGLRRSDIAQTTTPTLYHWANGGVIAELKPTFPCVTSSVQAGMRTGRSPGEHGVIANGFYHRDRREVEFWVGCNGVIQGKQIWDVINEHGLGLKSAVWHAQNIKGAAADYIVTPEPIHETDGTTRLWCYSKPEGTYQKLVNDLGHFPLQHYWGPLADIESTRWILRAAAWLNDYDPPNFHWIYLPHLDYAAQKHGPNSPEAKQALIELDNELSLFAERTPRSLQGKGKEDVTFLVAGEYALTNVTGPVYPNRILRDADLLSVREKDDAELIDFEASRAFAMVDHQLAHVYVKPGDEKTIGLVSEIFKGYTGIAGVYAGTHRRKIGLDHERSGEVILIAADGRWFAYYWWLSDAAAPAFARTVDIHRKPGYDPVELFFDPKTQSIPLNAELIRGSHGAPATKPQHRTALICSKATDAVKADQVYRDRDLYRTVFDLLEVASPHPQQ